MTGTYRKYVTINFKQETLDLIAQANVIIEDYEARGYMLTLRRLYYQMVAHNLISNKKSAYDRLGGVISDGRLTGLISWTAIEDRNRGLMGLQHYDNPYQLLDRARNGYRIDKWATQLFRPEVWVEKAALEGVIGEICNKLQVDFFSCRGYNSQSEQWRAGRRFAGYVQKGQRPIVFHLGDHDPSGLDMTEDNRNRLSLFAGVPINVVRLGLNMPQIEELRPPPNPVKPSDSRYGAYARRFGEECWELDALTPEYITKLIEDAVVAIRDQRAWDEMMAQESEDLRRLNMIVDELNDEDE
jgi:hypothetical protein